MYSNSTLCLLRRWLGERINNSLANTASAMRFLYKNNSALCHIRRQTPPEKVSVSSVRNTERVAAVALFYSLVNYCCWNTERNVQNKRHCVRLQVLLFVIVSGIDLQKVVHIKNYTTITLSFSIIHSRKERWLILMLYIKVYFKEAA